ncbi:hypothetical protein N7509_004165 [Penicillium cosmopolitanum]|uniref:Uncharacterized protein n=1 Tax=Penicillium cosmopolitanum TaxID=1131564 RepID=A0A9X0BC58_9EURO|nr:uncharacterized protein N7509_004165 [Penicillium cosmopolitanum]KAJ5404294.1 hypothetical protein N7509_004165 [Penicillium cosmopolitanum]
MRLFQYAKQNPLPEPSKAPRRPMMSWLFFDDNQYRIWEHNFDFFLGEEDHRSRLFEATIVEQNVQWTTTIMCSMRARLTTSFLNDPHMAKFTGSSTFRFARVQSQPRLKPSKPSSK